MIKSHQTRVGIPSKPAHRLSKNFVEPLSFLPERWLANADPKFDADRKDVYEPFMVGPRACLGKRSVSPRNFVFLSFPRERVIAFVDGEFKLTLINP